MPFKQLLKHAVDTVAQHQQRLNEPNIAVQPVFTWGPLITSSNQPTQLFTRLLDAIFTYFTNTPPVDPTGFHPSKYAAVFTALMYSDNDNLPRRYFIFASENHIPSPEQFAYQAMAIFYRTHHIQHTMNGATTTPILTREGFHSMMLRDTLGDPYVQHRRFNTFLAAHGGNLVDPMTGQRFLSLVIPRASFPEAMDSETWRREEQMTRAFNEELGVYLEELNRVGAWVHDVTMARTHGKNEGKGKKDLGGSSENAKKGSGESNKIGKKNTRGSNKSVKQEPDAKRQLNTNTRKPQKPNFNAKECGGRSITVLGKSSKKVHGQLPCQNLSQTDIDTFLRYGLSIDAGTANPSCQMPAILKIERVRWHPDMVQRLFCGRIDEEMMNAVTEISQIVNHLYGDEQAKGN
ncbi:hypothetical protein BDW59DRAFT_162932 [Aspergillus cavernicola]|uniref:DUF7514 domain-containing protein n=1 Tax=Aspergillus cavernicola TaxID=176166 RepID=A0ABR4I7N9_9EURO